MTENKQKSRIDISQDGGLRIYSLKGWPGIEELVGLLLIFVIIAIMLGTVLGIMYFANTFCEVLPWGWLRYIIYGVLTAGFSLSFIGVLVFVFLFIPYYLVYAMSPKRFWVEDDMFVHETKYAGIITRTKKVPLDIISEITAKRNGKKLFNIVIYYESQLPRWIVFIITYWSEKQAIINFAIANAIPDKAEAENIALELLGHVA